MRSDPPFDAYKTLQVDSEADPDVIQAAYRRLAQRFHPDTATDVESAVRMVSINRAWEILRDPARRAEYDRDRSARLTISSATFGAGGHRGNPPGPETVSPNWTSGRSTAGGGYDPSTMGASQGSTGVGPPPGNPSGSVLTFGRYAGWSLGEIARTDVLYIEWLDRMPIGRAYRDEIDGLLRRLGRRVSAEAAANERRGLFRRR